MRSFALFCGVTWAFVCTVNIPKTGMGERGRGGGRYEGQMFHRQLITPLTHTTVVNIFYVKYCQRFNVHKCVGWGGGGGGVYMVIIEIE